MREAAEPLKEAGVDTVILGCTHYPLIRPILQRVFGRDVTLVFSADETAREVVETLARKGIENDADREGVYRFLTTGDPDAFRDDGQPLPAAADRRGRARRASPSSRAWPRERLAARRPPPRRAPCARHPARTSSSSRTGASSGRRARRASSARQPSSEDIPRWLRGKGRGWMTAEYSLLPASTGERTQRGVTRGRPDGRTVEIQRLIGRALRAVCDFEALGERTLWLDCDVLQADGGTRCAAITGAYVAAYRALDRMGLSKALPAVGRRGLGRRRRRRRGARSRLPRGLAGRHRHERRDDRPTDASSRCRRRPSASRSTARRARRSCSTSPRSASRSSPLPSAQRADLPRRVRARLASGKPAQARRAAACAAGMGDRADRRLRPSPRRPARPTRRTRAARPFTAAPAPRPTPGSSARTRGSRLRRSEGGRGSRRPAGPPTASQQLLDGAHGCRRPARPLRLRDRRGRARRRREVAEGTLAGGIATATAAAPRDSATTRSSCPSGEARTVAELGDALEERALASRTRRRGARRRPPGG